MPADGYLTTVPGGESDPDPKPGLGGDTVKTTPGGGTDLGGYRDPIGPTGSANDIGAAVPAATTVPVGGSGQVKQPSFQH